MTPEQAVAKFFEIRGDDPQFVDSDEIAEAVREIGNPDANLHVVWTAETADDYRSNGWQDYRDEGGIVTLKRGKRIFANIADCGDHRLVYIEQ